MEMVLACGGLRGAVARSCPRSRKPLQQYSKRFLATPTESSGARSSPTDFQAAPQIQFRDDANQFVSRTAGRSQFSGRNDQGLLARVRVVPASPSYFTATPQYTDDLIHVSAVWRRHLALPMLPPGEAPRVAWKTLEDYQIETAEPVRVKAYNVLVAVLKRLNHIHPAILPTEVIETIAKFKRNVQPHLDQKKPIVVNQWGVARAVGRRKSSHAQVSLVEGEGECMVNGRSITEYFQRVHDRESALWALRATERTDKYNVWVLVQGGGTTGQAEAVTLGVAKALLAHEPALKPALRRAGVLTRDPRRVERKKPGHLKARKKPQWVKR